MMMISVYGIKLKTFMLKPVADPGFDLRRGVDFVNGGGVEHH